MHPLLFAIHFCLSIIRKIDIVSAIVAIGIIAGVLVGCQKDEDSNSENYDFENPYDFVGKYHNDGLLYVLERMDHPIRLKSSESDIENQVYNLTHDFCKQNPLGNNFSEEIYAASVQSVKNIRLKSTESRFSKVQILYHEKFNTLLANPEGCKSLSDVFSKLKSIEMEIYQSDMDEIDKTALLVTFAVGRNSLDFWFSIKPDNQVTRLKNGSETNSFLDWWSNTFLPAAKVVVISDAMSAAGGFMEGAVAGGTGGTALMPGVGSVTGAVVGGVAAGASSAIYGSAVAGIAYYFWE